MTHARNLRLLAEERDPQIRHWLEIGDELLNSDEPANDTETEPGTPGPRLVERQDTPVKHHKAKVLPFPGKKSK